MTTVSKKEIACQQILEKDGSVFSVQWVVIPGHHATRLDPEFIMERYFSYLRFFTLNLVRPLRTESGIEFRLLSSKLYLLSFATPIYFENTVVRSITLHICGGPFVQSRRCDRGSFSFQTEIFAAGVKVTLQLDEYHPRLLGSTTPGRFRKNLYRFTQAFVHKLVTTMFLASLYREMEGSEFLFKTVSVNVRDGENI